MAILTQLLLIVVVFATVYATFVHNRDAYKEIAHILPDFRKLVGNSEPAFVKVVIRVPDGYADIVRTAIGEAGGGIIGNYTFCSFSSSGVGRFTPGSGARPVVGDLGVPQLVAEERIEVTVSRENLKKVIAAIKKTHPYEEVVIDVYALTALPEDSAIHR